MSWQTVPICDVHWHAQMGDRAPVRLVAVDGLGPEPCYVCGEPADIYVRREV